MASHLAKNGKMLAAAGGIYIAACYIGYTAVQKNKADIEETEMALQSGAADQNFSFISNPNRTEQFQNVAAKYDDEIGRDESVMGINLLRRSLLYFHARGTVLEVGAGTGRNIGKYKSTKLMSNVLHSPLSHFASFYSSLLPVVRGGSCAHDGFFR
jgi:methyltransferase OMS1, mitochondrial